MQIMKELSFRFGFRGSPKPIEWIRVMKLFVLFVMLSSGSLFASVKAQQVKLNLEIENKSLIEIMDMLKEKAGVQFVYSGADVKNVNNISVSIKDKNVIEILDIVLKGTNLTYVQEGNLIILRHAHPVQAKDEKPRVVTGTVTGVVRSDTLAGVTVQIKGTSVGTATDIKGRYKLTLPAGSDVELIFSFIGKKTKIVKYTGQTELNVILEDDAEVLEEVVALGYLNTDKKKLTSAVTTLKAEDIMMPGVSSIDKMLEGHVPGLIFMQNSGQVGATPRLRIRGTSTVLGSQEPLWVLDGVVLTDPVNVNPDDINNLDFVNLLGNAISGLNPYDIEDINILKDASATALYGTKAANGVIVVTTKKGKVGPLRVNYHVDGSFARRPHYSDRAIYLMNSRERVDYSREAIEKGMTYKTTQDGWTGYEALVEQYNKGLISFDKLQEGTARFETMNTDWLGEITRNSFSHNHTLSFSGGSDNMRYHASIGYGRENGVLIKESADRYNSVLNLNFTQNKFSAQFKLSANVREQKHTPSDVGLLDYAYGTSRAVPLYDTDGSLFYHKVNKNTYSVYFNVLNERDNSYNTVKGHTLSLMTNLSYEIIPRLKAQATLSYSVSDTDNETYHAENTAYAAGYAQFELDPRYNDFVAKKNLTWPFGGELKKDNTKNTNYTLRGQVNYHHYLDEYEQHMLSVDVGGELNSSKYTGFAKTIRCYLPDRGLSVNQVDKDIWWGYADWLTTDANALGKLKDNTSNKVGMYGSLTYSFRNTYIFNVNARLDFSNEFGKLTNDKILPIWSVSGRWNLKENVFANINWVNNVALRASFGYQGNITNEATPELIIQKGNVNPIFNEYQSTIKTFPNPDLGWEKTASFNTSLDFSLFNNSLKGMVSYFYKKTKNAYLTKKVSRVNGVTSYKVNEGTVENSGFEFSFNIVPMNRMLSSISADGERKGFRWSIDPQLGQVVNKLINKLGRGSDFDPLHDDFTYEDYLNGKAYVSGRPLNSFFSYEFTGLSPEDGRPTFARVEEDLWDQYIDMPNSKVFTTVMQYSGCRVPYLQGGISNTFEYNNFILSFNLAYSIGSKIRLLKLYDNVSAGSSVPQPVKNMRKEFVRRWKRPGDEKKTNIPGILNATDFNNSINYPWWKNEPFSFAANIWQMYDFSNIRVVSGNYLKLKTLSLRYVMPQKICRKLHVKNMYVSLSGTNLLTWSAKELRGQDPTSQSGSADRINLSVRPTYSFSLDVSF